MATSGLIGTGITGLMAAQIGLQTAEHNITNANTAGFTRQRSSQASNLGMSTGAGFIGMGTHVSTVERLYSRFLTDQVNRSQSSTSQLDTYHQQISQIDNLLGDPSSGLSPELQRFFTSVQQVADNPADLPSRQAMIAGALSLSARYIALGDHLAQMTRAVDSEITSTITGINAFAEQIASLNQRIIVAQAPTGQPANDMLDTRDQLVAELNKLVKTSTTINSDGSYNVFIGNGQQLVVGAQVMGMTTQPSNSDQSRIAVGLKTATGTQEMPESLLDGGVLGGLLAFRRESLLPVINDLGRSAASLALTFNAQSALGQDLLGQSQLSSTPNSFTPDFFSVAGPQVLAGKMNPAGSADVSASFIDPPPYNGNFYTDLTGSDYQLTADASGVTLSRLTDNKQWTGADLTAINTQLASDPQGFTLAASAALVAGSSYLIQPTRNAMQTLQVNPSVAIDPRLITAAGPLSASISTSNLGSAKVNSGSVGAGYPAAVTSLPITLQFQNGQLQNFPVGTQVSIDGGTPVTITALSDTMAYTSGATITLVGSSTSTPPTGFSFTITGTPNTGDTFVIARNNGATADSRNALALARLQTQDTLSGKSSTFQEGYARLVNDTGNKARQVQISSDAQQSLLAEAQSHRDSFSGVNLDEEAANLIRYQQAYQASAKSLQVGSTLFDTILQVVAR